MSFEWPLALFGLLPVLGLAGLYWLAQQRRRRYTLTYSSIAIARTAASAGSRLRKHLPAALYLTALAVMVLALARPQASFATPQSGGVVILALDASGSMNTTDIKPSRIEAAQVAIRDFVKRQPKGVLIGVVAFAASPQVLVAPTGDREQVVNAIEFISLGRGTNIGGGLQMAVNTLVAHDQGEQVGASPAGPTLDTRGVSDSGTMTIVLLSDGASTTGPPALQIAAQVAQTGIKVYTVGLGVQGGGSAGLGPPGFGPSGGSFRELDETTLKGIAERTGGEYFAAKDAGELHKVYQSLSSRTYLAVEKDELTFLAAGGAALLMIAGGLLGAIWSARLP